MLKRHHSAGDAAAHDFAPPSHVWLHGIHARDGCELRP